MFLVRPGIIPIRCNWISLRRGLFLVEIFRLLPDILSKFNMSDLYKIGFTFPSVYIAYLFKDK